MKLLLCFTLIISNCAFSQCNLKKSFNNSHVYLTSTNNSQLDKLIFGEKNKLESLLMLKTKLNISKGTNGLAYPLCSLNNCNGTIELGVDLLKSEYKRPEGKYFIIGILAHEFAHIIQFESNMNFENTVQQEIHADIFAGWYLGYYFDKLIGNNPDRYLPASDLMYNIKSFKNNLKISFGQIGDTQYYSVNHHGNFLTRSMAFHHGIDSYERGFNNWREVFFRWGKRDASSIINKWNN